VIPYLVPAHYLQIQSTSVFFQCATLLPTSLLRNGTGAEAMSHLCLLNPVALAPNGIGTRDNASVPETMPVYPRQWQCTRDNARVCNGT